jgi:hypothetical protein
MLSEPNLTHPCIAIPGTKEHSEQEHGGHRKIASLN